MRKYNIFFLIALCSVLFTACTHKDSRLVDYVNPFVGTDAHGHTFPGATAPFGMVQLSPDTRVDTWDGCSGYHYSDSVILGFSHTHLSGTGCLDYGDVLMMPVTGYDADSLNRMLYQSEFSHSKERATAGYYEVFLERWKTLVRLTAGDRCGMHVYDYQGLEGSNPKIVIDLEHRDELLDSEIAYDSEQNAICGFRRSKSWNEDQMLYFYIQFSAPVQDYKPFANKGALVVFSDDLTQIISKVGISSVSVENAKANLLNEIAEDNFDFNALMDATQSKWEKFLSKIDVRGNGRESVEKLRTFYTALYHTAIAPNIYSDVDGRYRGMDKKIHTSEGYDRYTVFSLWDTFRSLHPLFTIIERDRTLDFVKSFMSIYDEGGKLPIWELAGYETNCMIGYNAMPVIADALVKGIDDYDVAKILDQMVASSNKDEYGIRYYRQRYVVPAEKEHESVSKTLEYAFDDWCIAVVANYLHVKTGDEKYAKICQEYMKYSASYVNVFDPETGCMRPMVSGAWLKPFDPREVNNHYTEANSWQYSFFAPHDVSGHMELLGGEEAYCAKIDSLFSASSKTKGRTQVDITGLIGQYAHGNEPSHHIAYLYTYAGKPWRTYEMVREIIETQYTDKPDGLCGNDDCGQMSAWYVLSAIGIYPVTPGSVDFVLTSPIFKDVVINLENGKQFHIKSDGGKYISSVTLNGQKYDKGYITFDDIKDGGELVMDLSKSKTDFAVAPECRPISSGYQGFIRNPWFEMESDIFDTSMEISIAGAPEGAKIMYKVESLRQGETLERMSDKRLAELESKGKFVEFTESFSVKKSSLVSAYVLAEDGRRSPIVRTAVYKLKDDMDIRTECVYNPQYNARGARGLIDGLRGSVNWKTGGWQGYQNTDFIAVLDLRGERRLSTFGSGYCQDARSWIWMPTEVEYYVSQDGKEYEFVGKVKNRVDPKDYTIQVDDFVLNTSPVKAKFVKVVAKNFGTIPEWHLGAGGKAFIFIDEIWVE